MRELRGRGRGGRPGTRAYIVEALIKSLEIKMFGYAPNSLEAPLSLTSFPKLSTPSDVPNVDG